METVFPMVGGLFAAWLLLPHRPEAVFGVAAIAVGAHYYGFRTAYGDWSYWCLASILCLSGVASVLFQVPDGGLLPMYVAGIEVLFGVWFVLIDRWQPADPKPGETT